MGLYDRDYWKERHKPKDTARLKQKLDSLQRGLDERGAPVSKPLSGGHTRPGRTQRRRELPEPLKHGLVWVGLIAVLTAGVAALT